MSIKYHDQNVGVTLGESVEPEIVLPSAYQRVEYLEYSPPIGIFVTIPTEKTLYQVEFSANSPGTGAETTAFGYREPYSNDNDFEFSVYNGNTLTWIRNTAKGSNQFNGGLAYTLGTKITLTMLLLSPRNTALIGSYGSDAALSTAYGLDGRVYGVKGFSPSMKSAWDVNAWFIPCYRKSDNQVGYYDAVGEAFYSTTNTYGLSQGSITAGPDVN